MLQDLHLSKYLHTGQQDHMLRTGMSRAPPISVGIIGAGFAGLRCADILLQHGFKVTILEARNRLGGRVGQSWNLGHPVDLYVSDFGSGIGDFDFQES
jgi:monoamine oxidase